MYWLVEVLIQSNLPLPVWTGKAPGSAKRAAKFDDDDDADISTAAGRSVKKGKGSLSFQLIELSGLH